MPVRIIKEDICSSYSLSQMSARAERLFFRLLVRTDDHGRFDADPQIVMSRCFERGGDDINVGNVRKWLNELAKPLEGEQTGMIAFYVVDGKNYGVFTGMKKHHRKRNTYSRFPPPTGDYFSSLNDIKPMAKVAKIETKKPKEKSKKDPFNDQLDPKAFGCADYLKMIILDYKPNHQLSTLTDEDWNSSPKRKSWAKEFKLANEKDGRPWEQINQILAWLSGDTFWMKIVQSGKKFREKYDRLEDEMNESRTKKKKTGRVLDGDVDLNDASWDELA